MSLKKLAKSTSPKLTVADLLRVLANFPDDMEVVINTEGYIDMIAKEFEANKLLLANTAMGYAPVMDKNTVKTVEGVYCLDYFDHDAVVVFEPCLVKVLVLTYNEVKF